MRVSSFGFTAALFVMLGTQGLLASTPAHAAELRYEEEGTVEVAEDESIDDTVFLAGKTAIVAGVVNGDVFAAAERVEVTGTVRGNLYGAGRTVTVAGEVSGNVHAAGKTVELGAKVGGSGYLAGQLVTLTEGGELARGGFFAGESVRSEGSVGRDLTFAAESMELSGTVERNLRGYGSEVTVSSRGSVGGDLRLTVSSDDAVKLDDGATVKGETTVEVEKKEERRAFLYPGFYFGVLAKALAMLLLGVVLVVLFPALLPPAPESSKDVLRNMGFGFVALLATPVLMGMVALTVIGIPISLLLGVVYALLLFLSTLVVAYFAAQRLAARDNRRLALHTGAMLLLILFVLAIPFVGAGLSFFVHIFGFGCLVLHLSKLYTERRGSIDSPTGGPGRAPTS